VQILAEEIIGLSWREKDMFLLARKGLRTLRHDHLLSSNSRLSRAQQKILA
jgi:hypothetical protein